MPLVQAAGVCEPEAKAPPSILPAQVLPLPESGALGCEVQTPGMPKGPVSPPGPPSSLTPCAWPVHQVWDTRASLVMRHLLQLQRGPKSPVRWVVLPLEEEIELTGPPGSCVG